MNEIEIKLVKKLDKKKLDQINLLVKQLDPNLPLLSPLDLKNIAHQKNVKIITSILKKAPKKIIGIVFLVYYQTLAGKRGRIEDLVVDVNYRQRGIGKKLVKYALNLAKKLKLKSIELTSRPERVAANKLYQKLKFIKRKTNVYKYNIIL